MNQNREALTLPELPYGYNALQPVLNGEILEVHHKKHHQGYVNNYNKLIDEISPLVKENDTVTLQPKLLGLHFNSGGHNCHSQYWENLAPKDNGGGILPEEKTQFNQQMLKDFGSWENFKNKFGSTTVAVKGSGWGWLGQDKITGNLSIRQTLNQDYIESDGYHPLMVVDVWEHAYYLQYKNLRKDYLDNIWDVINWKKVEERYNKINNLQLIKI